ncbi:MAG: hypothetical protein ACO1SV_11015 [Fimbriimonas sp.]
MLSFVVLALFSPPPVTVSMAGRTRVIAQEIAQDSGLRIEVARAVPDHSLIVSLRDVPAEEAIKRVAWAVYGQVESEGDLRRIVPDSVAINRARREYREWRVTRNRNLAAALKARLLGPEAGAEGVPGTHFRANSAGIRATVRLLQEMPPERWIDPDLWGRMYSTSPNRMQRPMPGRFLDEYQKELDKARVTLGAEPAKIQKAFLIVSDEDRPRIQHLAFSALGPQGTLVNEAHQDLYATFFNPEAIVPTVLPKAILDAVPEGTEVEWSEATRALMAVLLDADSTAPKETEALLADPLKIDPLTFGLRDLYEDLSRRTKSAVVVNVSDDNLWNLFFKGPTDLREGLRRVWSPFAKIEDGWIVDRPPVADPGWPWQIDRASFARFIAASRQTERDPFEARLAFLAESGRRPRWGLVAPFINVLLGESVMDAINQPGLQLLACLPPATRQYLAQGGTIPIRSLPEPAQANLWIRLAWGQLKPPANVVYHFATPMSEIFPNGLPAGILSGRERLTPYLRIWIPDAKGQSRAQVIACDAFGANPKLKPTRLEPLWFPLMEMRIQFEGGWRWENDLARKLRSAGPIVTSEASLPAAHQEAIAKARTRW